MSSLGHTKPYLGKAEGEWKTGQFGKFHGEDYLFKEIGDDKSSVKFSATLPQSGNFEVQEWHVAGPNRANNVSFVVSHSQGTNAVEVNQQQNGSRWNSFGTFHFNTTAEVKVSDGASNGKVVIVEPVCDIVIRDDRGNWQRKGIGTALLLFICEYFKLAGRKGIKGKIVETRRCGMDWSRKVIRFL